MSRVFSPWFRVWVFCLGLGLAMAIPASADIIISEFLASNQDGLKDEDGDSSDWIELYNDGTAPVNLAGWRLTDDPADSSKWILPSITLDPRGFLVVFASEKNRAVAGQPLHTNFKLSASGGYLGLIRANGTVASEYNPYPAQYDDRPYGYGQTVTATELVGSSANLRYLVPTSNSPSTASWTARTFSDGSWGSGKNGVGFESTVSGWLFKTFFSNT
ncbi:MAG: lamin tail domain-containing protein, partial [Verrucomicrobiaceae bacterium]